VENLRKAPRRPVVHTTITRQNRHNLEEFLDAMSALPIKGVGFSFYTPHRTDNGDGGLFIPLAERELVLEELLRLRKKYWRLWA
jgi:MoaA/NifB/PqqE/SkfB family radical SAM enzyme